MNENHIEIKEQRKDWLIKGITVLFLMLISLFIALLPMLLSIDTSGANNVFYLIGGGAFIIFTSFFVYNLYKECNPNVALSLNAHGFIDTKNVGEGIEIEWTNVASVKMLGRSDMPFLGIVLENSDIVMAKMKKGLAEDMRENISENLPAILISQNEIRIPITELKEMFSKFVREARAIENDNAKKTKTNPFTTDDVLRAFGQLPKEGKDDAATIAVPDEESDSDSPKENDAVSDSEEPQEINTKPTEDSESVETPDSGTKSSNDSFYEALRGKASENLENRLETEKEAPRSEDQISSEINDLLSKAKSSRIDELGKLLSDTDSPFTYQQDKHKDSVHGVDESKVNEEPTDDKDNGQSKAAETDENVINTDEQTTDDTNDEITLDSMIESALQKQEETISKNESEARKKSEIPDLATLVSDLDKKVQKKKKNFALQEKDESES